MKHIFYLLIVCLLANFNNLNAQDTLFLNPIQTSVGGNISVDISVKNFNDIVSLQYTMNYDHTALQFESLANLNPVLELTEGNFGLPGNIVVDGHITFSWVEIAGGTLDDGEILYTLYFTEVNGNNSDIYIDFNPAPPLPIVEASNTAGDLVFVQSIPFTIYGNAHFLSGNLFNDANNNCQRDNESGFANWQINVDGGTEVRTAETDENGDYSIIVNEGEYNINVVSPDENLVECNADLSIDILKSASYDIGMVAADVVSIEENQLSNLISVYPNPSNSVMTFELDHVKETAQLEIYNVVGELLLSQQFASNNMQLSKDDFEAGMYFYRVRVGKEVVGNGKVLFL